MYRDVMPVLTTLTINPTEICRVNSDFLSGRRGVVGRSYLYNLDTLRETASELNENVDRFITMRLASGLDSKPVRSRLMFWYAPGNNLVWLTACDKALKVGCYWMGNIPGYIDSGDEFVRDSARPYAYWNGRNLYRIYEFPEYFDASAFYASDLCNLFGLNVGTCEEWMYRLIRDERTEKWDYSVVPQSSEEIVDCDGKKLVVLHAFWTDGLRRITFKGGRRRRYGCSLRRVLSN